MGKAAVAKAFEDIKAALAVLNAEVDECGSEPFSDADPLAGLADGCLDILAGARVVEAGFAGLKARAAVTYADTAQAIAGPDAPVQAQEMAVAAEIGCLLALGSRAAGAFLAASHALCKELPPTLSALQAGTITWQHALAMVDETATLDPAGAAALEAYFLDPDAPEAAYGGPDRGDAGVPVQSEGQELAGTPSRRIHREAPRQGCGRPARRIPAGSGRHGLAVRVPARGPGDGGLEPAHRPRPRNAGTRTSPAPSPNLRADTFAAGPSQQRNHSGCAGAGGSDGTLTLPGNGIEGNDPGQVPSRAQVLVTVPVFSLMGLAEEPAMLDGYGPIPASMARNLVASGADSFYRVLVDPRDGAPLEIGRSSYRVSKAMRNWLRLRDGKCPFPGCSNHSLDNEADHILAWHQGGTTGISNLGQPCPKHHKLRHTSGWKPTPATKTAPPGWTSPSGRHYKSEHQDWEPPHWPNQLQAVSGDPPDFVYIGISPGEESLERFLHAPPA
jgi:hypothetical protein